MDEDHRRALRVTPLPEADGAPVRKPERIMSRRVTHWNSDSLTLISILRATVRTSSNWRTDWRTGQRTPCKRRFLGDL
jgi:hypothetical protein